MVLEVELTSFGPTNHKTIQAVQFARTIDRFKVTTGF